MRGLTSSWSLPPTSMTQACSGSPSCGAARPTPGAWRMESVRSSSSSWRYLPKLSTGRPLSRRRGSPSSTMGRTLMAARYTRGGSDRPQSVESGSTSTDHGASRPPSRSAAGSDAAQQDVPAPPAAASGDVGRAPARRRRRSSGAPTRGRAAGRPSRARRLRPHPRPAARRSASRGVRTAASRTAGVAPAPRRRRHAPSRATTAWIAGWSGW